MVYRTVKRYAINKRSEENEQNWLITLSDFLTLLLVFFIFFYMMNRQDKKDTLLQTQNDTASHAILQGGNGRIDSLSEKINAMVKRLNMESAVVVFHTNNEVVVDLKEKILFRPGEAVLLKESYPALKAIAQVIRDNEDLRVEIEGHTDNVPINNRFYPSNWELSMARSISVLRYFTEYEGIPASRFAVKGNADNSPIEGNATDAQRALNRRVEIRLKL